MFSRFATAGFGFALSLAATAQDLPVLATGTPTTETALVEQLLAIDGAQVTMPGAEPASVVPIWSGSDGHLLALVAVPGRWDLPLLADSTSRPGPASWYLLGDTNFSTSGLRWQAGNGFHADAIFSQQQSVLPALCGLACESSAVKGGFAGSLGLGWMSPDGGLDLSYGLSWLQASDDPIGLRALPSAGNGVGVPTLTLPNILTSGGLQSNTSLFAKGRWHFDDDTAIDIGASYGHARAQSFATLGSGVPGIDLDQLSLSLGVDSGSLRGAIVGHVLRSDDPALIGKKWTTLDLGVSWRTPWRAEISVGAQNLWSAPLDTSRETDPAQSRTPYIQYRQDL